VGICTAGAGPRSTTNSVTAETASVLNSAVPIEPPTCCDVLTIPEATPLSCAGTAVAIAKEQEEAEETGAGGSDREERGATVAVGDHAQRQQRVLDAALHGDEREQ
jgi:hypothetical protein